VNGKLREFVRQRAKLRCEYCGLPEVDSPTARHHLEHVVARKHGGATRASNLATACHRCNLNKATDLSGLDPSTGRLTRLFHPRRHKWNYHFRFEGNWIIGKTAIGRATVNVLRMNEPERLRLRECLAELGRFPW
jgi:hypothetical protein